MPVISVLVAIVFGLAALRGAVVFFVFFFFVAVFVTETFFLGVADVFAATRVFVALLFVNFFAGAFFGAPFLTAVFLATVLFVDLFLAAALLLTAFFAEVFLAAAFLLTVFLDTAFLPVVFRAASVFFNAFFGADLFAGAFLATGLRIGAAAVFAADVDFFFAVLIVLPAALLFFLRAGLAAPLPLFDMLTMISVSARVGSRKRDSRCEAF